MFSPGRSGLDRVHRVYDDGMSDVLDSLTVSIVIYICLSKRKNIKCLMTLYKNARFCLVNSRDIILHMQALHCEFAEYLLHVGVFA